MTYTPSGNPATGSEGLSALMRAEFAAIATAFVDLPSLTTTGVFNTIFAQLGSFTFTLPNGPGTLALTADVSAAVAVETAARATAVATEATTRASAITSEATTRATADTANATAIMTEATARATGDTANATAISTETTNRTTAIANEVTNRNAAIAVETARAEAVEGVNATAITAEATARAAAVATEVTNRNAAIAVETARAEGAEALLMGPTWHNVTGSRVAGTTYTNSASYPISVSLSLQVANTQAASATVGGVVIASFTSGFSGTYNFYFQVPAGETYVVTSSATLIASWFELF